MTILLVSLIVALTFGGLTAGCSYSDRSGTSNTSSMSSSTGGGDTVQQIVAQPVDDMMVTLRGQIMERLDEDDYNFTDGTGTIRVEIEDEDLPGGQPISPGTRVEIIGEVDKKDRGKSKIDVKRVRVLSR